MKRISKLLLRNCILCVFLVSFKSYTSGQSLVVLDSLYQNVTGTIVTVDCNTPAVEYREGFFIQNNSLSQISVKVKKYILSNVSGTSNIFSWGGSVFPPAVYTSSTTVQIQPDSIENEFFSYLYSSFTGTVSIMYVFFNVSDINDSASVIVNYTSSTLNIKNNFTMPVSIFPNPSNGIFTIENNGYNSLEIYNIHGQLYSKMSLNEKKIRIDLTCLPNGIYNIKFSNTQGFEWKKLIKK